MTSFLSKVIAVEIVAMQMTNTTSNTEAEIEFILNIACTRLAPCMFVEVFIHTIQCPSVSYFDVYGNMEKLKMMIVVLINRQISKKENI